MRLVSCSKCFKAYPIKETVVSEGKRVCHECRKKKK